jgi:hypothetical protein
MDPVGPDYNKPDKGPFIWGYKAAQRQDLTVAQRLQLFNLSTNPRYREGFVEGAAGMPKYRQLFGHKTKGIWAYYDRYGATPGEQGHIQGTNLQDWHTKWQTVPFLRPASLQSWNWWHSMPSQRHNLAENYKQYERRYRMNPPGNRAKQQESSMESIREHTINRPPGGTAEQHRIWKASHTSW